VSTEHTPNWDDCHLCGARIPDMEAVGVVDYVGLRCAVIYCVCEDCYTPEFESYLEEIEAFWRSQEKVQP
jgi:hypothetical protein